MSALPWIVGGLAAGGLYLWYRSRAAAPPPTDACGALCKASGPYCVDGGASCRALGQLAQSAGFDAGGAYYTERDRRESVNAGLNGAADIMNEPSQGIGYDVTSDGQIANPVGAKTLRYKSGCVPLYGSPGFAKCKAGTLDMYSSAIDSAAGKHLGLTETSLVHVGAYMTKADRDQVINNTNRPWPRIAKGDAMTGKSGDPLTQGPYSDGSGLWWYVRGKRVDGNVLGAAPRAVVMQKFNRDYLIAALSDQAASELVPIDQDPAVSRVSISQDSSGCVPGFTWVASATETGGGHWARPAAGQTPVCKPPATLLYAGGSTEHFVGVSK